MGEKSEWLSKYDDKHFSLKIDKFRQEKKTLGNTIQTIDSLVKLSAPLEVSNLEVDLAALKPPTTIAVSKISKFSRKLTGLEV